MKLGILGTGMVGQALGGKRAGLAMMLCSARATWP